RFDDALGQKHYKLLGHCFNGDPNRTFHLLDGQQRSTAIALGFLDVWDDAGQHNDGPALWVDVGPSPDERKYVFRVLTRSHPWGYSFKDPKSRMKSQDISDAMACFRLVGKLENVRASTLPLRHAWPWDSMCPIPVPLLVKVASDSRNWRDNLGEHLKTLPMWSDDAALKSGLSLISQWKKALDKTEADNPDSLSYKLDALVSLIRHEKGVKRIPGLILPTHAPDLGSTKNDEAMVKDAVETLFVRINSAGTNLGGEELIYSLLKSAWPEAPKTLETLQPNGRQIIAPARMVTFLVRLHAAWNDGKLTDKPPQTPTLAEFRKFMRSGGKESLREFVVGAETIITDLLELILLSSTGDADEEHPYRFPPTLAAQLFGSEKGQDTLLLISMWLLRLHSVEKTVGGLSRNQRQRTLGFIVAVNWFSDDVGRCLRRLWPYLCQHHRDSIADFFSSKQFSRLFPAEPDGKLVMLPIIPPDLLEHIIKSRVTNGSSRYPGPEFKDYWASAGNWAHYHGRLVPQEFSKLPKSLQKWLKNSGIGDYVEDANGQAKDSESRQERLRIAWLQFMDKIWSDRRLVDYAQRSWIMRWFHDFDPTLPGQMEDLNRPWDYDHIHPQSLGSSGYIRNLPAVIREWHTSIGNLRVWPLELNRCDQDDLPATKLNEINRETERFQLDKAEVIRKASFIVENEDWQYWKDSAPDELLVKNYLAVQDEKYKKHRKALVQAITIRFCRLYSEWYKQLALEELT
ncbi:MAG: hypothetical protein M0Z50_14840, partial [Planctomycetia bacterium]|nr:hypothetical protein [Planctomycetia bacterium]